MKLEYHTERLELKVLQLSDALFIKELVNSEGWLKFISNRNIHDLDAATAYISNINDNPFALYWTVIEKQSSKPIGIITYQKRDYLNQWDIGFAFLPQYSGNGFAFEAAKIVLEDILLNSSQTPVLALTKPENSRSIKLLNKLGFRFKSELNNGLLRYITAP